MKRVVLALAALGALAALFVVSAGAVASTTPKSYLVATKSGSLPANVAAQITAAGGTVTSTMPAIGIVVASSTSADFAAKAAKIGTVSANIRLQWVEPTRQIAGPGVDFANPPTSGDDDFFFDLQWGHDAIDAVEAWNAGYRGAGARVAVLDTGFDLDHPDLAPNINLGLSADFTGQGLQYTLPDPFSHGTHTAGTVAAADNAFGTIGVAPEAELVLVKVLSDEGSGTFADVLEGILYAAGPADADVISMSLGGILPKAGDPTDPDADTPEEVQALKHAMNRATNFAYRNGATVIASAGNDALDRDASDDYIILPADAVTVLQISATAPFGWAIDPTGFLDFQSSYTNYGRSAITYAAPGGDFLHPEEGPCTIAGLTRPCWVFDLVFSTGNNAWFWAAGTSMAAPHVAGTAALIIGKNGGDMNPAQVNKAILAGSDDLGDPGKDDTYGRGRVNAGNSVTLS
jgi:lantibiotic leader peptide-processing serine protease